ncbi:MAG: nitrite reductase small subunit NirD [Sedimenticola sp.]|nr:nitrite reductase small subunit NirD [Sedimenticola sp.]MCW8950641.1 nitrite reductase small subunit NirD [Sedimenticola sp.]MCW8976876.1 nitrite reductase small subunit NirD [Sedimenticola sp.]MCW9022144.1 nitrite reductase small subunit NirD [Sedimenticola sp.]MDF1530009.1 nitrite reductase small subunit NirD [Sedimenticola sp.]
MSAVMTEKWVEVGKLTEIPRLGSRVVKTKDDEIAIFRAGDDTVFALSNRCPHKQGPLSEGILHGHRVTCPLHNWVIELENGEAVAPDVGCVRSYPVRVEGEQIMLGI